jgi:hypothetical protein
MRLKTPRWLLFLEGFLLLGSLTVLAYKAATWVTSFPEVRLEQKRPSPKAYARPTILDYYRQYPDRYIRVENESWHLDNKTGIAIHNFSLRNLATVPYQEIVARIAYESADGKALLTRDIQIPGVLPSQETVSLKKIKVTGVPAATGTATVTVVKALMIQ